jgi:hypothetical protein
VEARHEAFGGKEVVFDPNHPREIELRFAKPASVNVRLHGLEELGLAAHVHLDLRRKLDEDHLSLSLRARAAKGDTPPFHPVQPGDWYAVLVLRFPGPGGVERFVLVDRMPLSVREGRNDFDGSVPALHTLRVVPAEAGDPLRLQLVRLDAYGRWTQQFARSDAGGAVTFEHVPAGSYEVVGKHRGERIRRRVEVPADREIQLD